MPGTAYRPIFRYNYAWKGLVIACKELIVDNSGGIHLDYCTGHIAWDNLVSGWFNHAKPHVDLLLKYSAFWNWRQTSRFSWRQDCSHSNSPPFVAHDVLLVLVDGYGDLSKIQQPEFSNTTSKWIWLSFKCWSETAEGSFKHRQHLWRLKMIDRLSTFSCFLFYLLTPWQKKWPVTSNTLSDSASSIIEGLRKRRKEYLANIFYTSD